MAAAVCHVLATGCKSSTPMINANWYNEGGCPVKFTSVCNSSGKTYSECVTVHVRMRKKDLHKSLHLEILCHHKVTVITSSKIRRAVRRTNELDKERNKQYEIQVSCIVSQEKLPHSNTTCHLVELVHNCGSTKAGKEISVIYQTTSRSCNDSYTVKAPVPKFTLTVNLSTKSFNVTVETGEKVNALWCYRSSANCMSENGVTPVAIDPSQSPSALLNFTYLLPCVCLQVYYTYTDSPRERKCPFEDQNLADVADVWLSSEVIPYDTHLTWKSQCPASSLNISAALCWRLHEHLCVVAPNSTLTTENGEHLNYNTSTVDVHPQMCIQFSSRGSSNISCPFLADMSTWEVNVGGGRRSLVLHLTSDIPATFSAQLCVPDQLGCAPQGEIHSVTAIKRADTSVAVTVDCPETQRCVQVWRSDPPLRGRRILCLDHAHRRSALYFVAASMLVAVGCLLGSFIYHQVKSGLATWLYIQKPVLLVSSSERSSHVAATCALASMLEGELSATVHTALWASTSKSQEGVRTGVADVGPLPWLYGQWEAVRDAQGKVLIVWSPEAKAAYEKWKRETLAGDEGETAGDKDEGTKKIKVEAKRHREKSRVRTCKERRRDGSPETERAPVVAPTFTAALACLEGALRQGKGQGVAVVYFQDLCHSRDVPRALRRVPRYCLPQDFRGLIQELGGMRQPAPTEEVSCCCWRCWPRLLSKALSIRLAQQLAGRLERLLRRSARDLGSLPRPTSEKSRGRFGLQRDEHERLHLSPGAAERR